MLSGEVGEKTTKWGPVQVVRASARVVGGKRTIIEKSQQLKEVQDLKVQKGQEHRGEAGGLCRAPDMLHLASPEDFMWLTARPDHRNKLKISDAGTFPASPAKKRDTEVVSMLSSPISTLSACWSVVATSDYGSSNEDQEGCLEAHLWIAC